MTYSNANHLINVVLDSQNFIVPKNNLIQFYMHIIYYCTNNFDVSKTILQITGSGTHSKWPPYTIYRFSPTIDL
jgi:hypothetical protein